MSPEELMTRYCDGDAAAFRALYDLAAPRLLGYLKRLSGNEATAQDLLQQTFLKLHHHRANYVRGADPMPWLYTIAQRTFFDESRRQKRAHVRLSVGAVPEVAANLSGGAQGEEPAEEVDAATREALNDAIERLPKQQRDALLLTKVHGKSMAEAAEILGTTRGALKVRAHRAYVALRAILGSSGGDKKQDD